MNLHAIAATIPIPVDARGRAARAHCSIDPQGHRCYFLLDGLVPSAPVGPAFKRPRDACDLADLLNGEGQPRVTEAVAAVASEEGSRETRCVVCHRPLDPKARSDRKTCSGACRVRLRRQRDPRLAHAKGSVLGSNRRALERGRPGVLTVQDVLELWERQPDCVDCGRGYGVDHIDPLELGGSNTPDNLQNLCPRCNSVKNARDGLGLPAQRARRAGASEAPRPSPVTLSPAPSAPSAPVSVN